MFSNSLHYLKQLIGKEHDTTDSITLLPRIQVILMEVSKKGRSRFDGTTFAIHSRYCAHHAEISSDEIGTWAGHGTPEVAQKKPRNPNRESTHIGKRSKWEETMLETQRCGKDDTNAT